MDELKSEIILGLIGLAVVVAQGITAYITKAAQTRNWISDEIRQAINIGATNVLAGAKAEVLDAMADGTITPDERDRIIEKVKREAQRLATLQGIEIFKHVTQPFVYSFAMKAIRKQIGSGT